MLPYTPLHHLLLAELGFPVVATSGNRSGEPIATDGAEAEHRLGDIADAFLDHDRPIVRPVDDSVARVFRGEPQVLRRARGYAPAPIPTGETSPGVLALGGHLKSAVALTQPDGIVLSQHIGDLDHPLSRDTHGAITDGLLRLNQGRPRILACDAHPDYATTVRAEEWSGREGLPLVRVPHHLAHVAAGMAEHGLAPPVLGVAWDGTGYGPDGTIWGGELIRVTRDGWQRAGHLRPFRLPGGAAAIREPWRAAIGLLYELFGPEALAMDHLAPVAGRSAAERRTLGRLLEQGTNAPVTTSAGRLFDGVAALLGLRQVADHEGQAACMVEWAADAGGEAPPYALTVGGPDPDTGARVLDWGPALRDVLADGAAGVPVSVRAARFHQGLAVAVAEAVRALGDDTVLLTGGCFQNALLADRTVERLEADGRRVLWPRAVPPGDGGLALGQAFWAARMKEKGAPSCA
jgi:hydrogenase maturation protein HypF